MLAPTGTIGFMMDCDTTGIEPDIALVKYKRLVGGGMLKIVNQHRPRGARQARLHRQGGRGDHRATSTRSDTIEGAPHLKDEHLPVFDCAFRAQNGTRSIHYMGHIQMMAAAQPFLSGAISKTVNLPTDCTVEDIENAYIQAWKLGLKAIAVYRDGCKRTQPLSTNRSRRRRTARVADRAIAAAAERRPLEPARPRGASPGRGAARAQDAPGRSADGEPLQAARRARARSPTSSRSAATRATSPSASTRTGRRARSSSAWRRKARPSPA